MKKILITLILFCFVLSVNAQDKLPTQSVYLELGGAGLIYSFNYDFRFDNQRMDGWGMRVGAGGYG
jgi:hypothetical protein